MDVVNQAQTPPSTTQPTQQNPSRETRASQPEQAAQFITKRQAAQQAKLEQRQENPPVEHFPNTQPIEKPPQPNEFAHQVKLKKRRDRSLEDLLAGPILAWIGGGAVLLGIAFFLAIAASRGWLNDTAKSLFAGSSSLGLIGFGMYARKRYRVPLAANATVAAGLAGFYTTMSVTSALYELIPISVGLASILVVGGCATVLAIRWRSQGLGALALFGPFVAQVFVGSSWPSVEIWELAYLLVASSWALCIQFKQRWHWIAFGVFLGPLVPWIVTITDDQLGFLPVVSFLFVMATISFCSIMLRIVDTPKSAVDAMTQPANDNKQASLALAGPVLSATLTVALSIFLLAAQASALGLVGYLAIDHSVSLQQGPALYLVLLGVAYGVMGRFLMKRLAQQLSFFALPAFSLAVVFTDTAFGFLFNDLGRTVAWSAVIPVFALTMGKVKRHIQSAPAWQEPLLALGVGAQIVASTYNLLLTEGSPVHIGDQTSDLRLSTIIGVLSIAVSCFTAGALFDTRQRTWKAATQAIGTVAVIYLTVLAFNGVTLVIAFIVQGAALLKASQYERQRNENIVAEVALYIASFCVLAALTHSLIFEAPPTALTNGVDSLLDAGIALGASTFGLLVSGRIWMSQKHDVARALFTASAAVVLYLTVLAFDGVVLVIALVVQAVVLCIVNQYQMKRTETTMAEVEIYAASCYLLSALIHTLIFEAPPTALAYGVDSLSHAVIALTVTIFGFLFVHKTWMQKQAKVAQVLSVVAVIAGLYLASTALVDVSQANGSGNRTERSQLLLSSLWTIVGAIGLVIGLIRDRKPLRIDGLTLLFVAIGKVFLIDLQELNAEYRVLSLVVLGIMLLISAAIWQRTRRARTTL